MKFILFIFTLVSFQTLKSIAQPNLKLIAGAHHAFAADYELPQYFTPSYRFGLGIDVPIKAGFGMETGILFNKNKITMYQRKIDELGSQMGVKEIHSQNLSQLTFPLLVNYGKNLNSNHKISGSIGMYYSFSLSSFIHYETELFDDGRRYHSSNTKIFLKRTFSPTLNLDKNIAVNDLSTNLFIPSFYVSIDWNFFDRYSLRIFYQRDLYNYYFTNKHTSQVANFSWQSIGIQCSYHIINF